MNKENTDWTKLAEELKNGDSFDKLIGLPVVKALIQTQRDRAKAEAYAEVIKEVERVEWLSGKLKLYGISSSLKLKFLTK